MTTKNELFNLLERKEEISTKFESTRATWYILSEELFSETDDAKFEILDAKETAARVKWNAATQELNEINSKVLAFRKSVSRKKFMEWQSEYYTDMKIEQLTHLKLVPAQDVNAQPKFKKFN